MNRKTLNTLAAATLALAIGLTVSAARSAHPGPGAVLSMHKQLFAALDRGDVERVGGFIAESRRGASWSDASDPGKQAWGAARGFLAYLPDSEGRGVCAENEDEGVQRLIAWSQDASKKKAGGWKTEIKRAWSDCHSEDISFAMIEFERSRSTPGGTQRERYRSTSLVSYQGGRWVLWHIHISPQA